MSKLVNLVLVAASLLLLSSTARAQFEKYKEIKAYEIRPGLFITPVYTRRHAVCEISIEKRHYFGNTVNMDGVMSKDQILLLFDELVPSEQRGQPGSKPPGYTEIFQTDGGILTTSIPYEYVTLELFGKRDYPDNQKYVTAIITWNDPQCDPK